MALIDFFDRGCLINREGVAFAMAGREWTFAESQDHSCRIANGLLARGIGKGQHGAVLAGNNPAAWLCVVGFWRAGVAWVPLNPRDSAQESANLIGGFDVDTLFFQSAFAPVVQELRATCPGLKHVVCIDGDIEGALSLEALIDGVDATPPTGRTASDDVVAIMPTGGTTGLPKGVMQTNRNLSLSVINGVINTPYPPGEPIVNLAGAPMTHSAGFMSISATARGG